MMMALLWWGAISEALAVITCYITDPVAGPRKRK